MNWEIREYSRNKHAIHYDIKAGEKAGIFICSDLHWDNPKCDRKLLKEHFDKAKELGAPIFVNGDFFCAMQGKYDPRRSKKDIRPEHNKTNYLDALVNTAVEWFEPYKDNLALVGQGNHETGILKNCETDLLVRFVERFNYAYGAKLHAGGYGGHLALKMTQSQNTRSYVIKYFHGSGGGGPVTKGVIQNNRMATYIRGVDCITQGHVHQAYSHFDPVEVFDSKSMSVSKKNLLHLRTPTYKEEYEDQFGGWHVERGAPPKPLGGCYMHLEYHRVDDSRFVTASPEFWVTA